MPKSASFLLVLASLSLLAAASPAHADRGHGGGGGGGGHHAAPAPLLAAGIPAFAVLGAGAVVRFVKRRRRPANPAS